MRSEIDIVGYSRKTGKSSKTGKEYDFVVLSFLVEDRFTIGHKALTATCDFEVVSRVITEDHLDVLRHGQFVSVNCVYHFQNGRVFIDAFV